MKYPGLLLSTTAYFKKTGSRSRVRHSLQIGMYLFGLLFFLTGCGTVYTYSETAPDGKTEKWTRVTRKSTRNTCARVEQNIIKDLQTGTIQTREITRYDCRAVTEKVVSCRRWQRENGKLVKQEEQCKPHHF